MILSRYSLLIAPYNAQLVALMDSNFGIYALTFLFFLGIILIVFSSRLTNFIIYHHTSVIITAIAWYCLEKEDHTKSTYFFIGSTCAQITWFVTVKKFVKRRFGLLLVLLGIYIPRICIEYGESGWYDLLYVFIFGCSIALCIYRSEFFRVLVGCFTGSCVVCGCIGYLVAKKIVSTPALFSAVASTCIGMIINYRLASKKQVNVSRIHTDNLQFKEVITN
ncbi:hypothetical protein COBT_002050 [Conglomerata obtusa]